MHGNDGPRRAGRRSRAAALCVTAVAGATLLTGCSEDSPPPSVEFGSARPAGDRLGIQAPPNASVRLSQWPDGCKLLTNGEIQAFLPQAKSFEREPVKVSILNFDPLAESDPGTTGDVPRGGCEFSFNLPDGGSSDYANSHITVTVTALADPALIAKRYDEDKQDKTKEKDFTDLAATWGPEGCYRVGGVTGDEVYCRQGPYLFELDGSSSAEGLVKDPGVGAKPAENLAAAEKRRTIWTEKALSQAARTVAARMS
ncbi:hypothetical protein [Streptomyces sp. NPDC001508]|uniref:hypothetical protein n=1 Tax=Streptomyces sp. NPDC001508 TaxID=3154656 RepID=UPI00331E2340